MTYFLAIALGAIGALIWIAWAFESDVIGFDFEGTLWDPAVAIWNGRSPYPDAVVTEVEVGNPAVYPPLLMVVVVPLIVLPEAVGTAVWISLLGVAVVAALALLGVRDLRCYALAMFSAPVVWGLIWGNVTLLLVPLVALAWRWRDRWALAGLCVGLAIAAKLFLWPLAVWLLGTRRYRAAAMAIGSAAAGLLVPWAVIGFDGLRAYPALLDVAEQVYAVHSYSIATMLSAIGVDTETAVRLTLAMGVSLAALAFAAGRRKLDETSISIAVVAAILGSPIVWEHYYALLLVPVAIVRPRLSWLWVTFVAFYFTHGLPRPRLSASELEPGESACCRPPDVPSVSWVFNHAPPGLWPALANAAIVAAVGFACVWLSRGLRHGRANAPAGASRSP
jgi:alpha-1,2-mannosyltransferase